MTDQRPQYGELATPEEQRRAAGLPPVAHGETTAAAPLTETASTRRPSPIDRFVTIALLAYGLINVVMTALSYIDFPAAMTEVMKTLRIDGEFTNVAQGRLWGTIAALILAVGWSLTAALAIRRLRRGRISWWVPVVGAAVTLTLTSICVAIPMMGDPAFIDFITRATAP